MDRVYDVIVIGAGASGLMAAGTAARAGRDVLLLERNERPGRKLGITGRGRCNITNNCGRDEFLRSVARNPRFLYAALDALDAQAAMAFFESLGLSLVTERGNRVFPASQRARDVIDALTDWCRREGVRLRQGCTVTGLRMEEGSVTGVETDAGAFSSAAIILATGGMSYPATGSTGMGYAFARQAGHSVTALAPSLVPLRSDDPCCGAMQGLSLKNVSISVTRAETGGNKTLYRDFGEMLFTHCGVSGPVVLSASSHLCGAMPCTLHIDLKPALEEQRLDARLLRDFTDRANKQLPSALAGLLPQSMIPVIIERSGIPRQTPAHSVTRTQRRTLVSLLKDFSIRITGTHPIEEAVITSGGVDVREIEPGTMRSKRVRGLSFCGEILDVDAYTGGFNLQIAWSTGYLAGLHA